RPAATADAVETASAITAMTSVALTGRSIGTGSADVNVSRTTSGRPVTCTGNIAVCAEGAERRQEEKGCHDESATSCTPSVVLPSLTSIEKVVECMPPNKSQ